METIVLYVLIWSLGLAVLFRFTPNNKINAMANFFSKVMPTIPFTKMFGYWIDMKGEKSKK